MYKSFKKSKDIFFAVYDVEEIKDEIRSRFPKAKFCIIDKNRSIQDALYEAQSNSTTKMFWFVDFGCEIIDNFDFSYEVPEWDQQYVHVFKDNLNNYKNVYIIPKHYAISKKEAEHVFFINKKEIDRQAARKKLPDIFFAVYDVEEYKQQIRSRFPKAKFCIIDETHTVQDALYAAQQRSATSMFWFVDHEHELNDNFNIDYRVPVWDQQYVHTFKNSGAFLISKYYTISDKESMYLFFVNKKETDTIITHRKSPDVFFAINHENSKEKIRYKFPKAKFCLITDNKIQNAVYEAQKRSSTDMFWFVEPEYELIESDLNYSVPDWDKQYVHVFQEKKSEQFTGSYLIPKQYKIAEKEAEHVFFINKKEISQITTSLLDYEVFTVDTYDDYLTARDTSLTDMFYVVFSDLKVSENFKFNYTVNKKSKHLNYVFKNGTAYDGIFLTSKTQKITKKEYESRFLIDRSEIDIQASEVEKYEIINCNSYSEYLKKIKDVESDMVYLTTDNFVINEAFEFDYQVPKWHQDKIHVFKNGKYFDGICLLPTNKTVSQKDFDYRFFVNKMEVDIAASTPKPFDIVFISYDENNADENYQNLLKRFPKAKRIHGVKGIHQAHKKAAEIVETSMFWAVDGDADILDNFNFDHQVPAWSLDVVHVCRSKNPINDLEYGYGGVKLLPTELTKLLDENTVDMTTSISSKFRLLPMISNHTRFNTDPFNTWKSAFRECVKLSSKIIVGQNDKETVHRMHIWCTEGKDRQFGDYAIKGAIQGREFGAKYKDDPRMLAKINSWNWLEEKFKDIDDQ